MNYHYSHIRTSAPLTSLPRILSQHLLSHSIGSLHSNHSHIDFYTVIYIHYSTQDLFRMRFNCQYSIIFTY